MGSFLNGASGTLEPFTYEITTTNPTDGAAISTTGSSGPSAYVNLTSIPAEEGELVIVRMTSDRLTGDVRTFSRTR